MKVCLASLLFLLLVTGCSDPTGTLAPDAAVRRPPAIQPAAQGDSFNNGGGRSEQLITYAWVDLGRVIRACLASDGCRLEEAARHRLQTILLTLSRETGGVKFVSSSQFASSHDAYPVAISDEARTAARVGSPLLFDSDRLDARGVWSLPRATGELTAALSLHHSAGRSDETETSARIREALVRFTTDTVESFSFANLGIPELEVVTVPSGADLAPNDVLLVDTSSVRSLTTFFQDHFACPDERGRPEKVSLSNLFALRVGTQVTLFVRAARFHCHGSRGDDVAWDGGFRFYLDLKTEGGRTQWSPESSRIQGVDLCRVPNVSA